MADVSEVFVVYGENDEARWVEAVFTSQAAADEAELWFSANPPPHNGPYTYEAGYGFKLREGFDPNDPYGWGYEDEAEEVVAGD